MNQMNQIGRYQILSQLASGGMALVYRAYDPRFKREVAIKVMAPHFLHDPQFRQRFEREAQVIASLQHPAIVPVHDFGSKNGHPYLVMALMSGGTLTERLQHGPLSLQETARLLERLAPALDMAHQKGVIHRDLKPDNILFDEQENPYIADFGIAKLMAETTMGLSQSGMVIGTPFYMSPEQARGEKAIDGRSDIYSLGAILFELLTGQRPYDADTPAGFIYKHIYEPIPSICHLRADLPHSCETVITLAMAKDRERRYPTVQQFAAAWKTVVEKCNISNNYSLPHVTEGPKATPKSGEGHTTVLIPRSWRQRWSLASLAALLVIVIGAVILLRMAGLDGASTIFSTNTNFDERDNGNGIVIEPTKSPIITHTHTNTFSLLTNSPTTVPEDTPVPSNTPKPSPTNSATTVPEDTPVPSNTPKPSPTNSATTVPEDTPVPSSTPNPSPTNSPTSVPEDTPVPSNTPKPAPTSAPVVIYVGDAVRVTEVAGYTGLNLRSLPSFDGTIIRVLEPGTLLEVIDDGPDRWWRTRSPFNGEEGWVTSFFDGKNFLERAPISIPPAIQTGGYVKVAKVDGYTGLNLRRLPTIESEIVKLLEFGTLLEVIGGPEGLWWQVRSPSGIQGWVVTFSFEGELNLEATPP